MSYPCVVCWESHSSSDIFALSIRVFIKLTTEVPGFSLIIWPEVDKIGQTKGFCLSWIWDKIIVCPASVIPPFLDLEERSP
jgi:hypothetical protein